MVSPTCLPALQHDFVTVFKDGEDVAVMRELVTRSQSASPGGGQDEADEPNTGAEKPAAQGQAKSSTGDAAASAGPKEERSLPCTPAGGDAPTVSTTTNVSPPPLRGNAGVKEPAVVKGVTSPSKSARQKRNGEGGGDRKAGLTSPARLREATNKPPSKKNSASPGHKNSRPTIKTAFQIALEEHNVLAAGKQQLQAQQREMRKLFKKQGERLKKLREKHVSEVESIRKQQKADLNTLKTTHESASNKERQRCKQALEAVDSHQRKASEELAKELKKFLAKSRKTHEKAHKIKVVQVRKLHEEENKDILGAREAKQATKLQVEAFTAEEWNTFEKNTKELVLNETVVHEARATTARLQKMRQLKAETAHVKLQLLRERLALIKEHRSGLLQSKAKDHCTELHALKERHQVDRHALERKLLAESHKAVTEVMQKSHAKEAKSFRSTLRSKPTEIRRSVQSLSPLQPVSEATGGGSSAAAGTPSIKPAKSRRDRATASFKSTASSKNSPTSTRKKNDKHQLKVAKEEHIKAETLRLSTMQAEQLQEHKARAEHQVGQLQLHHARQDEQLKQAQASELAAMQARFVGAEKATQQLLESEENSMVQEAKAEDSQLESSNAKNVKRLTLQMNEAIGILARLYLPTEFQRGEAITALVGPVVN